MLLVDRVCYPIVSWLDLARGPAEANLRLLMIINLPLNLAEGEEEEGEGGPIFRSGPKGANYVISGLR